MEEHAKGLGAPCLLAGVKAAEAQLAAAKSALEGARQALQWVIPGCGLGSLACRPCASCMPRPRSCSKRQEQLAEATAELVCPAGPLTPDLPLGTLTASPPLAHPSLPPAPSPPCRKREQQLAEATAEVEAAAGERQRLQEQATAAEASIQGGWVGEVGGLGWGGGVGGAAGSAAWR